jgi:type IV secretion system protein VirB9
VLSHRLRRRQSPDFKENDVRAIFVVTAFVTARALAESAPAPGLLDPRIRSAGYSADQVYVLKGFVGFETDLQFEAGEHFVGLGAGDIEGISFVAEDNHLFLKPKAAKVGTNLTILTSRRTYQIDYSASPVRPDATEDVTYALRFTYPVVQTAAGAASAELNADPHRARNFDYWFCGNPVLKPVAASDDGVHTRLRFAGNAEQPAIFVLNEDGSESLLNFSMDDGDVILHRIARRLILRRGGLAGCIVNKGFSGSGERLKSNTVSSEVQRTVPEARP